MSLNGAGRLVEIEQSQCVRCMSVVWCVRGEREHPLYENEDGTGEAIRNRDRAEAIVDAMAFVKRYADHSAFYAAEATDILKRAGLR